MFKELFILSEKVSPDCSTGSGVVPGVGPYRGFIVIRTNHLDDVRPPGQEERDEGFDCDVFDKIMKRFFQKRPLGVSDGTYELSWKNSRGYQVAIIQISNDEKKIRFVTIMQLNKKSPKDYRPKRGSIKIDLGKIEEPK